MGGRKTGVGGSKTVNTEFGNSKPGESVKKRLGGTEIRDTGHMKRTVRWDQKATGGSEAG